MPLTADAILGNGSAAGDGRVLDALTQLSAHLRGGTAADLQAIQSTDLQAIKANQTAVSSAISAIGAMSNRATAAADRLVDLEDTAKQTIDDLVGVDTVQGPHRLHRTVCRLSGLVEGRRADHPAVPTPLPPMSSGLNNPNNGGDSTMAVTLQSSRFGELQIPEEAVLDFPNGLIGLGGRRFALLARSEESAFVWLHSMDDPDLAVPVTSPWRFFEDYELELADDEAERIGVHAPEDASVYVTVRSAAALEDFCANLRAPILVVGNAGHQVINQAPDAPVRAPLFAGLQEEPSTKAA